LPDASSKLSATQRPSDGIARGFPKTPKGVDLMTDSPTAVSPKQLRDLYIDVKVKKQE
jgi:aspartyl-tRNA synthetase